MSRRRCGLSIVSIALSALLALTACDSGTVNGKPGDAGGDGPPCTSERRCGSSCCAATEVCAASTCVTPTGDCSGGQACSEDARCIDGHCIPWQSTPMSPYDTSCTREMQPGQTLRPQLQCAWEPPAGGNENDYALRHTPLVINFGLAGPDQAASPSIVIVGYATYQESVPRICQSNGAVVILDGRSCKERYVLSDPADAVLATVTPAAADIDGDGRAEIIAANTDGGLKAFGYDASKKTFVQRWRSKDALGQPSQLGADTCLWGAITVADLDGGAPEILFHGVVHDAQGNELASIPGYTPFGWSSPMVVADVDLDGKPEILEGYGTYRYENGALTMIPGWVGTVANGVDAGFVAVADFGDFPGKAGDAPGRPEVVVVNGQGVRVQTILGEVLFSGAPGYGSGGPPTVADFDGDGKPEIGVAYGDAYVVYDLGCVGKPAGCADEGVLWRRTSQDKSSARTGSSVFDFNGDGRAEVVYGDECFVRVYDGPTGQVLFSQGRFSSTWQENPIVADVDGDNSAEIVLPASGPCVPSYCSLFDESFVGLPCKDAGDCPGGGCDAAYCRCTDDQQCGGSFACSDAPAGTAGSGKVCRTKHEGCAPGLRVYRDAKDRWAGSRSVWNQHAYHVTNIDEDGHVPTFDKIARNWQTAGLNNFRQNVQGKLGPLPAVDLTVREVSVSCAQGKTTFSATVCNRGSSAADQGVRVAIVDVKSGNELCATVTAGFIDPGACETVQCEGSLSAETTVEARVNAAGDVAECRGDNNASAPKQALCIN